ncbi:MAG TPA: HEAT repeat domain-containing protein [Syntrophobacteria bacterium]|nr:HEAT repeat domain-containing protein [Syntrophobacteria bacterium]
MTARVGPPEKIGPPPRPEDPHEEIKARLARFLLALIQAFLRTGYYTPNHPQAKSAKVGLYDEFEKLFEGHGELTLLVRDDPKGLNVLIEGILPEAQYLTSIMARGMAEMYLPKFVKFLENKELIGLTLKSSMSREEFTKFVDVMGEPTFLETRNQSDKERFTRTLQERGIVNISYIYKEELLGEKRNIPWRAQIALSRLRKDFKMIPFFVDLGKEDLKKVRRQIIQDVARPVQYVEVIYPILLNTELAETNEIKEAEIDGEIIACLSDPALLRVTEKLLKETERGGTSAPSRDKATGLAKRLATVLNQRDVAGRDTVLDAYFKLNLIPFDQLPKDIKRRIELKRFTEEFLHRSGTLFKNFDKIQNREEYLQIGQSLAIIIPDLVRSDRYDDVLKLVDHLDRHAQEKKEVSTYAEQMLEEISQAGLFQELKAKFRTGKKELCEAIAPIFLKMRRRSSVHLLALSKESSDHLVRKLAYELLVRIDPSAVDLILSELQGRKAATGFTIDTIRIFGDIRWGVWNQLVANALKAYLTHGSPHVREEALGAYCRIRGVEAEKLCLALLNDPDAGVQKKAIQCLATMRSRQGLDIFVAMLKRMDDATDGKNEQLEARLFSALGFYENIERAIVDSLEDILLGRLVRHLSFGSSTLNFLKKKKETLSDEAVAAICETLGKIGSAKSRATLEKLGKGDSARRAKAEAAMARIAERAAQLTSGNATQPH